MTRAISKLVNQLKKRSSNIELSSRSKETVLCVVVVVKKKALESSTLRTESFEREVLMNH